MREGSPFPDLRWWEAGAGAGSTLGLHVLIGVAGDAGMNRREARAIDAAYFPWIGALHSLLDSLVDCGEDRAMGMRGLIDCYLSPPEAAVRMRTIAREALRRARLLPQGSRHALILAAMTSFYLCDVQSSSARLPSAVIPPVLEEMGSLATPNMTMLRVRRSLRAAAGAGQPLGLPGGESERVSV